MVLGSAVYWLSSWKKGFPLPAGSPLPYASVRGWDGTTAGGKPPSEDGEENRWACGLGGDAALLD